MSVTKRYSLRQSTRLGINLIQGRAVMPTPSASIYYSYNMGGVDVTDLKVSNYTLVFRHRKWWVPVFFFYLNMCLGNVQVLYQQLTGTKINGKDLRIQLSKQLIGNQSYRLTRGRKRTNATLNNSGFIDWEQIGF